MHLTKFMAARTGPSLPKALLEELESQDGAGHKYRSKAGTRLSRKDARKQERQGRKQRKAVFFAGHGTQAIHGVKRDAEQEHPESPRRKKAKVAHPGSSAPKTSGRDKDGHSAALADGLGTKPKLEKKATSKPEKLAKPSNKASSKTRSTPSVSAMVHTREEEKEDKYIAYLESKLGWRKGGRRTNNYGKGGDDGLDDLLQDLESMEKSVFSHSKAVSHLESDPEDISETASGGNDAVDREGLSAEQSDEDEGWDGIGDSAGDLPLPDEQNDSVLDEVEQSITTSALQTSTPSADATSESRYVPPHLRNREASAHGDTEAQFKLTRQLKGLLNRMSEQNIASITDGVDEIYRNHRRHDVTSSITTLIVEGISAHSMLLDSYVVLHAAFVSALHKLIGVEFAAYFVQNVVATYERHFADLKNDLHTTIAQPDTEKSHVAGDTLGKECSNLIILLSELYNFQVISCVLVYDVIRGLLEGELTEFQVELLLKITRNSGPQLRQDDPTALKSIIQMVHSKLPSQANAMSSRTRFMVETLTNLKNNKLKRNAGATPGGEAVERLKKFLAGLSKKRHVLAHEPLRVSLDDLHSAESKGKWWLVGAAWGGDPLVDHQESRREAIAKVEADVLSENALQKLARKQGMNTEIRRGIFVVLMSSEDYVDAQERLSQLKLTEVQQREIIRVILHCCGNEKAYNPYYTLVGQQLCRMSHSHKITLQFCLWDFLRDMGETNVGGAEIIKNLGEDAGFDVKSISSTRIKNIAGAYGWWIAKDCCTLAILKPVDFTVLQPQSRTFLKELLTQIFISTQVSTPLLSRNPKDLPKGHNRGPLEEVFMKATRVQTLVIGLVYFIGDVFKGDGIEDDGFLKWAAQVARDTLRTGMDVVAGL